ncbi:hypothetical protein K490DRAFT_70888 [Saccharata proteae CBS 121410]|uniref:Uncharacterized protein n=1 Tax=Saccharata proteae CBS 121410 TaxID=1314787 RepID=A0A9P4LZ46_9PEZI|nr:hypothetical protein K490DRAFT_70888 [Saccharata proteae CBS 121410]
MSRYMGWDREEMRAMGSRADSDDMGSEPQPKKRPPFPKPVRDRSAVIGLNPDPTIRVCFRVGEALNVGSKAVRENRMVFIELYARVRSSSRNGVRQSFVFQDLYHDHPPYLNAVYDIWKGVPLWEYDSGRFLQERDTPKMCRCIGKMKREDTGWKFVILNIWEAGPEDIDTVKGIIAA